MNIQEYWGALTPRQRVGLGVGFLLIAIATAAAGMWALRDFYVPLASGLTQERQSIALRELERQKIPYRMSDDAETVLVEASSLGKARAALASGGAGMPAAVGLELFKETDFSTTDFAQRINYQRALQGELTRTLQTISGVRSARVHVVLPESGLLKRNKVKSSVAINLQLVPGKTLTASQVMGIQRLAAASVPEIQASDVVVLDEMGSTLSRSSADPEGAEASGSQLDLKRQVDGYLEGKLHRVLSDLAPQAQVTLSADATLDFKHLKVTTEEPIAASGKDADRPTGVVAKERQSQRSSSESAGKADSKPADTSDWEYEYKVGSRVEQSLSLPGAVKRISVAVAIRGAPSALSNGEVERLVGNAVGLDPARGDSVVVVFLPRDPVLAVSQDEAPARAPLPVPSGTKSNAGGGGFAAFAWPATGICLLLAALIWLVLRRAPAAPQPDIDADLATAKVKAWLANEGHAP